MDPPNDQTQSQSRSFRPKMPPPPALPPLTQVAYCVLHADARLAALPHVAESISAFLDVSPHVTLARAVASGSARLIDRVAFHTLSDASLDPALREYWFAKALEAAIQTNDLTIVQKIHALHPEPLDARSLKLALEFSSLWVVQYVVEHRHDILCCPPGLPNLCSSCLRVAMPRVLSDHRVASWLVVDSGNDAWRVDQLVVHSADVLRWRQARCTMTKVGARELLVSALLTPSADAVNVVRYLLPQVSSISSQHLIHGLISASCQRGLEDAVQMVLDSRLCDAIRGTKVVYAATRPGGAKVLRWDSAYKIYRGALRGTTIADRTKYYATKHRHFDALQWSYHELGTAADCDHFQAMSSEDALLVQLQWLSAGVLQARLPKYVELAAEQGYVKLMAWLHENVDSAINVARAMDVAAGNGHVDVAEWLQDKHPTLTFSHEAINLAATNGHLTAAQWLHGHEAPFNSAKAMACAAANGHLEVLVWLYEHHTNGCTRCIKEKLLHHPLNDVSFEQRGAPVLHTLQWLDRNAVAAVDCIGECFFAGRPTDNIVKVTARSGNVGLLNYLYENHSELFPASRTGLGGAEGAEHQLPAFLSGQADREQGLWQGL